CPITSSLRWTAVRRRRHPFPTRRSSDLRQRIQVHGDMRHLQINANAARIRALLLAGIRSARLWRQLGGNRWQMLFARKKMLNELDRKSTRLNSSHVKTSYAVFCSKKKEP